MTFSPAPPILSYESRLDENPRWALSEGSRHFEGQSAVFEALHKIARRLDELGIPYVVVGGMALFHHGFRRFTEDVDILVTREDLKRIHSRLEGLGYLPPHRHSKNLRDTDLGVRIEFLTTGDFPGDGKEKPVAFPDPALAYTESDGIKYVGLPTLVELKLASGMTNAGRLKDLADVMELIKVLHLPENFSENLHPFVRDQFRKLWRQSHKRYVAEWPESKPALRGSSIAEVIANLKNSEAGPLVQSDIELLETMQRDGVSLEKLSDLADGIIVLATFDPEVARKYDMIDELEFWNEDPGREPTSI